MRNILFVTPAYLPFVSGAVTLTEALVRRLVESGWRVTILTTNARRASDFWIQPRRPETPPPIADTPDGLRVERLPIRYPSPAPYTFGLLRRAGHWLSRIGLPPGAQRPALRWLSRYMPPLRELPAAAARLARDADLVHVVESSWDGLFVGAAGAALAAHKPFVATPLMHLGDAAVRSHFVMAHQVSVYRQADAVLALSSAEADGYRRLGVAAEKVHLLTMGIEPLSAEMLAPNLGPDFRQEHGITGPCVAFLGANTYDKGAHTLALAAAQLARTDSPVTVVYAGPESEDLLAFIERQPETIRNDLTRWTRILGVVDQSTKHQLLAACDMLALPSQVDTFGIVFLEAWAHAKPVIGARAGGIPDLVRDEVDGLLSPFGNAPALAGAIVRLANDPDLAVRLGAAGQRRVVSDFTWDRTFETLLGVYRSVMGTHLS